MIFQLTSAFLIASICGAQVPQTQSMQNPAPAVPAAPAPGTLTVPAGTKIPLTLSTPIHSKSTKVGDAVRAVVAFPVMAGNQVAIPAGTYVEGTVSAVKTRGPGVEINFTQLMFANGYSTPLSAASTESRLFMLRTEPEEAGELAYAAAPAAGAGLGEGQEEPPPLPHVGPPMGPIIGATFGGVGVLVVLAVLSHRHHGTADYVLFASGWQFDMVLNAPVTLDAGRVAADMAAAPAQ
ncbi:MAG TPA: hypothetical protein VMD25_08495 [Acidobacteriaceae bacterium]|nr:hypothetical protein [Acidobacteriaceae bacterium]